MKKIELVRQLAVDYNDIISALYDLILSKFKNTQWEKSLSEIQQMYFLAGVSLKSDNRTWWLVLEPDVNVPSFYDYFLRFTMVDRKIIWSNV